MAQAKNGRRLAGLMGWLSFGLGAVQLVSPAAINRLVGVRDTAASKTVMRAVGVQELVFAGGILTRPRNAGLLWARVAGDVMHLGMLARVARDDRNDSGRVVPAASAAAGVMLLDLVAAMRLGRSARSEARRLRVRSTITVNRPAAEVYAYWRDLENLPSFMLHLESVEDIDGQRSRWVARAPAKARIEWDAQIVEDIPEQVVAWRSLEGADVPNSGVVRFKAAPGGAGTEVSVELDYQPPGGRLGAAVATLFGEEPEQQVKDGLRRFKQVMETGEVVRSDGSPEGTATQRQLLQHAAQPSA